AHQLHDEVGRSPLGCPCIKYPGDVWMIHQGKGLAFGLKPSDDALGLHAEFDDLERYPAADWLLLFGQVNHAATALSNLLQQLIPPDPRANRFVAGRFRADGLRQGRPAPVTAGEARQFAQGLTALREEPLGVVRRCQQTLQPRAQGGIPRAGAIEKGPALGSISQHPSGIEQLLLTLVRCAHRSVSASVMRGSWSESDTGGCAGA